MRRRDRRTQMWVYPSLFAVITHCFIKRRLTSDVSQFLKDLNLIESPPIPSLGSSKGKEKARPEERSERPGAKKGNIGFRVKSEATNPSFSQPEITFCFPTNIAIACRTSSSRVLAIGNTYYLTWPAIIIIHQATELHHKDISTFQTSSTANSSSSEASFPSKIIQSGTLSDKLSALTLLVQSSPLHNIKTLETLKGTAERGKGKGGREESLKALRCIVDWWVGGRAPNRKIRCGL